MPVHEMATRRRPAFIVDAVTKAMDNMGHHAAKTRHKRGNADTTNNSALHSLV